MTFDEAMTRLFASRNRVSKHGEQTGNDLAGPAFAISTQDRANLNSGPMSWPSAACRALT